MIEHRLIERVIQVMKGQVDRIETEKKVDSDLLEGVINFFQGYADRCHHGKEEGILFRDINKKALSPEHKRIVEELMEEHKLGRKTTAALGDAIQRYQSGDSEALPLIAAGLQSLVEFYPRHIEKEDKHFFLPIMAYFGKEEKDAMLKEGYEFDSKLIHEEYEKRVRALRSVLA
jgi:hemerythrin-like domain-containing protein